MSKIADETLFKLIHDFLLIYLPTQRNSSQIQYGPIKLPSKCCLTSLRSTIKLP